VDPSVLFIVCKHEDPGAFLVLIWSVLMIFVTIQHILREYCVAVNIALLAAIFVEWMFTFAEMDVFSIFRRKNGVNLNMSEKKEQVLQLRL
jgi:asparagine N-glycosylation enzyme membrane subunit Stt3